MVRKADTRLDRAASPLPEPASGEEGFLTRWSRRKHAVRGGQAVADDVVAETAPPEPESTEVAGEPCEPLTDADMPPIDTLDEQSDYAGFMSPEVSEELRRAALRKLFQLPQFNVRDGLNDYDEDYTTFPELGGMITHEMRRMLERQEAQALAADAEAAEAEVTPPEFDGTPAVQSSSKSTDETAPPDGTAADNAPITPEKSEHRSG